MSGNECIEDSCDISCETCYSESEAGYNATPNLNCKTCNLNYYLNGI